MRTVTKIGLTILAFLIGGVIIAGLNDAQGREKSGGPIALILALGIGAAVRAIWKYKPENEKDDNTNADNQTLDKT